MKGSVQVQDKLTFKQMLIIVAFGIVLFVGLMNLDVVFDAIGYVINIASPLVYGGVVAVVLNVLMSAIEKGIRRIFKKHTPKDSLITAISLLLSFAIIIGFIVAVVVLIVPQFAAAIPRIKSSFEANWDTIAEFCRNIGVNPSNLLTFISSFDLNSLLQKFTANIGNIFGTIASAASSIGGGVFMTAISLVACIYILMGKKKLAVQAKGVLYAYVDEKYADKILYFFRTLSETFKRFLSSQCIDACILGALLCVTMLILRLPYAGVISAMTVIFALIPYFGAFFSCAVGALLIALIQPKSALIFVVVFLVIQQIEGNLIYPKVVGNSVGLPALWTLLAVYVGGKLFGVVGMVLFIPVVSVIYTLISTDVKKKLAMKKNRDNTNAASV